MIFELIEKRRAIFPAQYNDRPISEDTIEKILAAANWAPTHKKTEPWRFKVVVGPARSRLGRFLSSTYEETAEKPKQIKIKKLRENPVRAAAVILICMQRDPQKSLPEWEELAATAMAVQNMWLACTELNIGSYWSSPALIDHLGGFVEMQPGERCLGLFYMGYFDGELPEGDRRPIEQKTTWIRE